MSDPVALDHKTEEGPFGLWNIDAVYSDDMGLSWNRGEVASGGLISTSPGKTVSLVIEAQFVERSDGSVRFNVRRWEGKPVRKTSLSEDGGRTWSKIEDVPGLLDPGCMGSVFRYSFPVEGGKSRILSSGPQGPRRENGTIWTNNTATEIQRSQKSPGTQPTGRIAGVTVCCSPN